MREADKPAGLEERPPQGLDDHRLLQTLEGKVNNEIQQYLVGIVHKMEDVRAHVSLLKMRDVEQDLLAMLPAVVADLESMIVNP